MWTCVSKKLMNICLIITPLLLFCSSLHCWENAPLTPPQVVLEVCTALNSNNLRYLQALAEGVHHKTNFSLCCLLWFLILLYTETSHWSVVVQHVLPYWSVWCHKHSFWGITLRAWGERGKLKQWHNELKATICDLQGNWNVFWGNDT